MLGHPPIQVHQIHFSYPCVRCGAMLHVYLQSDPLLILPNPQICQCGAAIRADFACRVDVRIRHATYPNPPVNNDAASEPEPQASTTPRDQGVRAFGKP